MLFNIRVKFLNNNWSQINEFVIIKNIALLKVAHLTAKEDKNITKAIKDLIDSEKLENQSFIAIKTKAKLMKSLKSN